MVYSKFVLNCDYQLPEQSEKVLILRSRMTLLQNYREATTVFFFKYVYKKTVTTDIFIVVFSDLPIRITDVEHSTLLLRHVVEVY